MSLCGGSGWTVSVSLSAFLKPTLNTSWAMPAGSALANSQTGQAPRSSRPQAQKGCSPHFPFSGDSLFGDSNSEVSVAEVGPSSLVRLLSCKWQKVRFKMVISMNSIWLLREIGINNSPSKLEGYLFFTKKKSRVWQARAAMNPGNFFFFFF